MIYADHNDCVKGVFCVRGHFLLREFLIYSLRLASLLAVYGMLTENTPLAFRLPWLLIHKGLLGLNEPPLRFHSWLIYWFHLSLYVMFNDIRPAPSPASLHSIMYKLAVLLAHVNMAEWSGSPDIVQKCISQRLWWDCNILYSVCHELHDMLQTAMQSGRKQNTITAEIENGHFIKCQNYIYFLWR